MKTIYVDTDYKCHATNTGGLVAVETTVFDDKCDTFIEGYRFVPAGKSWIREDGTVFQGEMIAPWRGYDLLMEFQLQYNKSQHCISELEKQLANAYTEESLEEAYLEGVNSL